jgi:hypothetical protein
VNDIESPALDESHAVREVAEVRDATAWDVVFKRPVFEKEQLAAMPFFLQR